MPLGRSILVALLFVIPAAASEPREGKTGTDLHGNPLPEGAVARFGMPRLYHGSADHLESSPDGKLLATSGNGGARVWDLATGRVVAFPHLPDSDRAWLRFAPDGAHVLCDTKGARIIDPNTGKVRFAVEKEGQKAYRVALSPNGKTLAVYWEDKVTVHDVEGPGGNERQLEADNVHEMCFSADGSLLVWRREGGAILLWDARRGKLLREYGEEQLGDHGVAAIALSPDGKQLAAALTDKKVHAWDTTSHKELEGFTPPDVACSFLRFSVDGKELLGIRQDALEVVCWSAATGKELRRLGNPDGPAPYETQALAADGKTFAQCYYGMIRVWDLATGKDLPGTERFPALHGVRWLGPDVVSVHGGQGRVFFWDRKDGRLRRQHKLPEAGLLGEPDAVSPDGKLLATSVDSSIVLYDLATEKELRRFGKFNEVMNLSFSPDGKALVAVDFHNGITVWDVAAGKLLREYAGRETHDGAFSPDLRTVVFVRGDGDGPRPPSICLAELASGKVRHTFLMHGNRKGSWAHLLRFSRDGRLLAVLAEYDVCVYSLPQGRVVFHLGLYEGKGNIEAGDLSPDGRWLARNSPAGDGILLHDLEHPEAAVAVKTLDGHLREITSMAFSPDGKYLVSASRDGTALVWDLRPIAAAAKSTKPDLVAAEAYWKALGDEDAEKAGRAMLALHRFPEVTLPLLKSRLRPAEAPPPDRLRRLIADLDSGEFAVRDKADKELAQLAEQAELALGEALKGKPSPEVSRRIERLLTRLEEPVSDPEQLRCLRAVEVLERLATPEALDLLRSLAIGAPAARLTKEAKASLERLTPRPDE